MSDIRGLLQLAHIPLCHTTSHMCPHLSFVDHLMFFKHICTPAPWQVLFHLLAATLLCVLKSYLYFDNKLNGMVFSMVPEIFEPSVNQMMVIIDFSSVKTPLTSFPGRMSLDSSFPVQLNTKGCFSWLWDVFLSPLWGS